MHVLEPRTRHVRVDLGRRQVAVTEKHLHDAQIGTVVQQVRREGMPQRVRREVLADARLARVTLDDVPERLSRHAVAAARREQVVGLTLEQDLDARALQELLYPLHGLLAQWNQPLAVALADDSKYALIQVHLAELEV